MCAHAVRNICASAAPCRYALLWWVSQKCSRELLCGSQLSIPLDASWLRVDGLHVRLSERLRACKLIFPKDQAGNANNCAMCPVNPVEACAIGEQIEIQM